MAFVFMLLNEFVDVKTLNDRVFTVNMLKLFVVEVRHVPQAIPFEADIVIGLIPTKLAGSALPYRKFAVKPFTLIVLKAFDEMIVLKSILFAVRILNALVTEVAGKLRYVRAFIVLTVIVLNPFADTRTLYVNILNAFTVDDAILFWLMIITGGCPLNAIAIDTIKLNKKRNRPNIFAPFISLHLWKPLPLGWVRKEVIQDSYSHKNILIAVVLVESRVIFLSSATTFYL